MIARLSAGRADPERVKALAAEAAMRHGVMVREILSPAKRFPVAKARGEVMFRLWGHGFSVNAIARSVDRDHATVRYWLAKAGVGGMARNDGGDGPALCGCVPGHRVSVLTSICIDCGLTEEDAYNRRVWPCYRPGQWPNDVAVPLRAIV